jgi:hypothetical protein
VFIIFSENRAVYGVRWKSIVSLDRSHITIRHTCFACCITKATNTHSEYVIFIDFHCIDGCTIAHQCKGIPALPLLFPYSAWRRMRMGEIAPLTLNSNHVWRWVVNIVTLTADCLTLGKRVPDLPSLECWDIPGAGVVCSEKRYRKTC